MTTPTQPVAPPPPSPAADTPPAEGGLRPGAPPPVAEPPKPEPRKYKVADREYTDTDPEFQRVLEAGHDLARQTAGLKKGFGELGGRQRALEAREARLRDASAVWDALKDLGHDPDKLVEARALEMYQASQLSEPERALRQLEQERARFVREKDEHAAAQREQEVDAGARAFAQMMEQTLPPLLDAAGLKGDGLALRDVADMLDAWTADGSAVTPAHMERAVRLAGERLDGRLRTRAAACTSAEQRKQLLGPELYAAVKADLYADYQARKASAGTTPPAPAKAEQPREPNGRYAERQPETVPGYFWVT